MSPVVEKFSTAITGGCRAEEFIWIKFRTQEGGISSIYSPIITQPQYTIPQKFIIGVV